MQRLVNSKYTKWLLIVLGSLSWSLTMVKSGLCWNRECASGLGFWGPNGHDGIWHIALINSLARSSLEMPTYAGQSIQNYHLGFDLLLAVTNRLTSIPSHVLYFQLVPPVLAFLIGFLTYKLVFEWKKSHAQALFSVFFIYFGGSFGWIVTLFRNGNFSGESMFWAQQAVSTLLNPPFALSLIFLLSGLYYLARYEKTSNKKYLLFCSIFFGTVGAVKVYAGILVLCTLGMVAFIKLLKGKFIYTYAFIFSLILFVLLFKLLSNVSGNLLIFQPFWFLETMMAISDRVGWPKFYEAMINYRAAGNLPKAVLAYLFALIIFWFGNLGTRGIKEFLVMKWIINFKKSTVFEMSFSIIIILGFLIPLFFLQKGTPWNTIQFIYYSLFFSGILAGCTLGEWLEKKTTRYNILIFLVIIFTLPTTMSTLWYHYLPNRPPARISSEELEALSFLNKQPLGVVLTYPFDRIASQKAINSPPRPLYLYESTSYVSAFANKPVFLEDEVNLDITGYNWQPRREKVENFLISNNQDEVRLFLKENNISYIYWIKGQRAILGEKQLGVSRIFENKTVDVYKVDNI